MRRRVVVNGPAERFPAKRFRAQLRQGTSWYRIQDQADSDTAVIYLYDEIGYWGTTAERFVDELKAITAPKIRLHINSPGGEVFDALAIYNTLKAHSANVHVVIDGIAASAASFIAQAGDKITIGRNAMVMIHDAAGLTWGNATDMRSFADLLDTLSDNIADIYAYRAGGTVESWRERMRDESWYTGSEAVANGLADEQTDPDPDPDEPAEMRNNWDLSIFTYAGRAAAPAPVPVERELVASASPVPGPTGGLVDLVALSAYNESRLAQPVAVATEPLPAEPAPAADPVPEPDPEPAPEPPADPEPEVEPEPELVLADVADVWAEFTRHLAPQTPDDLLASLREALQ